VAVVPAAASRVWLQRDQICRVDDEGRFGFSDGGLLGELIRSPAVATYI
jgi:hypothetical protein